MFKTICIVWGLLLVVGGLGLVANSAPPASPAEVNQLQVTQPTEYRSQAFGTCMRAVENAAKYDLRWTSWVKFYRVDGIVHSDGKILFHGDEAEAQNGFGAWVRVHYICIFDPKTKLADVSMEPGRFPH